MLNVICNQRKKKKGQLKEKKQGIFSLLEKKQVEQASPHRSTVLEVYLQRSIALLPFLSCNSHQKKIHVSSVLLKTKQIPSSR